MAHHRRPPRTGLKITAWLAALSLTSVGVVAYDQHRNDIAAAHAAAVEHAATAARTATAITTQTRTHALAVRAAQAQTLTDASAAVAAARGTLDATPNAGDGPRAALAAAITAVEAAVTTETNTWSAAGTVTATAGLAPAQQAANDAQAAWQAEQERIAREKKAAEERAAREAAERAAAERAARAAKQKNTSTSTSNGARKPSPAAPAAPQQNNNNGGGAGGGSVQSQAEAYLRSLPGAGGAYISWNHPDLSGHLGAVWLRCGNEQIMVNAGRLGSNLGKTKAVIAHELAHVFQNRLICAHGYDGVKSALDGAFGGNGIEKSADCVALRFGASWVNYTRDCAGEAKQAWVSGLIGGYRP